MVGDAPAASCDRGCAVYPGTQSTVGVQFGNGPMIYNMDGWLPSGDVCTPDPEPGTPDGQACVQQGTLTQCLKPDGRTCTQASNGKEHCWRIDEHGIKASGNEATTKAPENVPPKPPALPPPNGGDWVQQAVSQITAAINGQTSTSTVTQYQSSYGTSGQGASGHGADGEGKGGSGSGSGLGGGSGSGSGSGDGDGDGDGDGPGSPGGQLGDLYTSDGKTVASVFQAFRSRVGDSPLIDAIGNFFSAQGGGACPVFTIGASTYWEAMSFDGHCSGDFLAALQSIGWVLMAAAALLAAYWALS